jgi:hypothetical protein
MSWIFDTAQRLPALIYPSVLKDIFSWAGSQSGVSRVEIEDSSLSLVSIFYSTHTDDSLRRPEIISSS